MRISLFQRHSRKLSPRTHTHSDMHRRTMDTTVSKEFVLILRAAVDLQCSLGRLEPSHRVRPDNSESYQTDTEHSRTWFPRPPPIDAQHAGLIPPQTRNTAQESVVLFAGHRVHPAYWWILLSSWLIQRKWSISCFCVHESMCHCVICVLALCSGPVSLVFQNHLQTELYLVNKMSTKWVVCFLAVRPWTGKPVKIIRVFFS